MPITQKLINFFDFIQVIVLLVTFLILFSFFGDLKEKIGKIIDAVKEFFGRKFKSAKDFFGEKFCRIKEFIFKHREIFYIVIIGILIGFFSGDLEINFGDNLSTSIVAFLAHLFISLIVIAIWLIIAYILNLFLKIQKKDYYYICTILILIGHIILISIYY